MQQLQCDTAKPQSGPVRTATEAFHPGLVDGQAAARWTVDYLHRTDGNCCPYCGVEIEDEARLKRWYQGERSKCSSPGCGRFYTSRTNTIADGSILDFTEIFVLKCLLEWGVPAATIATIIPINKETVGRWEKRFQAMESVSV